MEKQQVLENLMILKGAVNTSFLQITLNKENLSCFFDFGESINYKLLEDFKVPKIHSIFLTQHRRTHTCGILNLKSDHINSIKMYGPEAEISLLSNNQKYWNDKKLRWHIYTHQPGPLVPHQNIPNVIGLKENDEIEIGNLKISVIDTPGITDGSVSYITTIAQKSVIFCGDIIYGDGMLLDLYSLQKGFKNITDYHGFIGNKFKLIKSLQKITKFKPDILIPSHGPIINKPHQTIKRLIDRINRLWVNYTSISSLNWHFPKLFSDLKNHPDRMLPSQTLEFPDFFIPIASTSLIILSDIGSALLIDCGAKQVIKKLKRLIKKRKITKLEACWITHYHDDHVDFVPQLIKQFNCEIIVENHQVDILEHPLKYFLPCISPSKFKISQIRKDGEAWNWHEYSLTSFHLPGQTFYHGGLLVEGHGKKLFISGDSGNPTGIDDHCCPNRNFLREGKGFLRCIEIWRETNPDFIINQHVPVAFKFTPKELNYLKDQQLKRMEILKEITPWDDVNYALDENWVRTYPYEQNCISGEDITISVQFTNHSTSERIAAAEPILTEGLEKDNKIGMKDLIIPPLTSGTVYEFEKNPDGEISFTIRIPKKIKKGKYIIPFKVYWDSNYLGPFRHTIINIL